jgi:hypothetical protein
MKNILFILLFHCFALNFYGQTYTLSTSTQTYQELSGATDITGGSLWDDDVWQLPFGFNMPIFNTNLSSVSLNSNGYLTDSVGSAEITIGMSRIDLVDGAFLINFNNPIPITYLTTGTAGNQICKVQWKQANVWGQSSGDVVNYQIWFYEQSGNIEFHFDTLALTNMPTISVQKFSSPPLFDDGFAVKGDPANPATSTVINQELNSAPASGTVYTFVRSSLTGFAEPEANNFSVFPQPAHDYIIIENKVEELQDFEIISIAGKRVATGTIQNKNERIDISKLNQGLYILNLSTSSGRKASQKIIIRH